MAGYVNGSGANGKGGPDDDGDDRKIASLDEARRRQAARAKEAQRRERAGRLGRMTARDWIVGGLFIAMALGMVWHWFSPLVGTTGATR
jgi:hypothetical protein